MRRAEFLRVLLRPCAAWPEERFLCLRPTDRTFLFEGPQDGWSETHVFQSPETDPRALAGVMSSIMQKRSTMLGNEYSGIGVRIRRVTDNDGNFVKRNAYPIVQFFGPPQSVGGEGDPDFVAALGIATTADGNNSTRVYFGGVPDAVTVSPSKMNFGLPAARPFATGFNQWVVAMRGSTTQAGPLTPGYYQYPLIGTFDVLSYVVGLDTRVTFTCPELIRSRLKRSAMSSGHALRRSTRASRYSTRKCWCTSPARKPFSLSSRKRPGRSPGWAA